MKKTYRLTYSSDGILVLTVVSRPELSSTVGAELAEECAKEMARLVTSSTRGIVMELQDAPPVVGPRTSRTIATMFRLADGGIPLAILISSSATQQLQLSRILIDSECGTGRFFTSADHAHAWAGSGRGRVSGVLKIDDRSEKKWIGEG